jgi:predicted CXXCH cytochrome family protein
MKKSIVAVLAIGLVLSLGTIAMAGSAPGTGIVGTYHDLSLGAPSGAMGDTLDHSTPVAEQGNRICIYCHAPHNTFPADATLNKYRPLWNHTASLNSTFTMYSNGTDVPGSISHQSQAMALLSGPAVPGSVSMLCLSCHDGSQAPNSYGFASNTAPAKSSGVAQAIGARAVIGLNGDLQNHHPIGFNYDQAQALDNELRVSTHDISASTGGAFTAGPGTIADLMWNGNVECVSCHDVHNTGNKGVKFTWINDTQSALCLACHVKDGTDPTL